jgi:molecular chaperone GrpE
MPDSRDPREHEIPVKVIDRRWWAHPEEPDATEQAPGEKWQPGKPTYVEQLEAQLAEKDRQLQEVLAKYRDAAREFDDSRARLRKDIAREIERGRRVLLAELLEVVDNLDRAIEAARAGTGPGALLQGVEAVRRLFLAKLDGFGVQRVDPLGEQFDPSRHEAITVVPTSEPAQDGIVCGVLAPGYLVGEEVLRPARVAVTRLAGD